MLEGSLRIAIDIGGTFTDLQVLEESSGRCFACKQPTTPDDPSQGFMDAIAAAQAAFGFHLDQVSAIFHGTTIATNAVLEHKLPPAALITTNGFRDVLEIARHTRQDVYASFAEARRLLIPRSHRLEVAERMEASGTIAQPIEPASMASVLAQLETLEVSSVAVVLLHAYANPAHELAVAEALRERFGEGLHISLSHEVSPEIREYERTSTTALNALLMPVVSAYVNALETRMREAGFSPPLFLVQSNGGVVRPDTAAQNPARLLLSGPSGGAIAAEQLAASLDEPNLIGIDLGGTSFDVSVLTDGAPRIVNEGAVDACPVRLPMVEIRTIGAGGGSLARADATGRLLVGPESAGASPGPACYRRGGEHATLTDANVALGRIDPQYFLGGGMELDGKAASAVIEKDVARPLELATDAAAEGITRIAISHMAAAIRLSLFEKGLDPKDFSIVSFGGAGGLHAAQVAEALEIPRVVYPKNAGTLSAWGMLFCDIVHAFARTRLTLADRDAHATLSPLIEDLVQQGTEALIADQVAPGARTLRFSLDMRYRGQAYELSVPVSGETLDASAIDAANSAFHDLHEASFAHADRTEIPEIVTVRLNALGRLARPQLELTQHAEPAEPKGLRRIWHDGEHIEIPVFDRAAFGEQDSASGPLILDDAHSTIFLPGSWWVEGTSSGDLIAQSLTDNPMAALHE